MHQNTIRPMAGVCFLMLGAILLWPQQGEAKKPPKYKLRNYKPKVGDSYLVTKKHYERWSNTLANGKRVCMLKNVYKIRYRETVLSVRNGWISKRRRQYSRCWFQLYEYHMKQGVTMNKRRHCVYRKKTIIIDGFGELAGISHNSKPLYGAGIHLIQEEMKARARAQAGYHMYIPYRPVRVGESWKISVLQWLVSARIPPHIFDLRKAYFRGKLLAIKTKQFKGKEHPLATIRLRGKFPFDLFPGHARVTGVMRLYLKGDINQKKDLPIGDMVAHSSLKFTGILHTTQGSRWATMRVRARTAYTIRP